MISSSGSAALSSRSFRDAALIVCALTIVRLVALRLSTVDLFIDESQYWSWSREPALGYFSKPPLLAWLIAAAEHLCGPSEACVRSPAPLMALATSVLAYATGRALYDARTGFWAAMLAAFGTGSVFAARIVSTDVPLVLFWALALFAYVRLLQKADWRWAIALGLAIGAGLLAKYAMIYFLAGLLLAAAFEKRARALLAKREIWLALGLAVIVVSPNLLWNAVNGFLTFRHAGANVIGEPIDLSVMRPLEFLAAQFAVFGPAVFGVAIVATIALLAGRASAYSGPASSPSPQSKSAAAHFDPFIESPKPAHTRFRLGEGWGGGSCLVAPRVPHPSTPTPDPSPAEPRYSEGSATRQSDRSRQQPTSVRGGERRLWRPKCDSLTLKGVGSQQLSPADRILLGFALPPLIVVTATASLVHAYANWAAASFIPLAVLAAAVLVRRNFRILLWGSLALGLAAQITLIGADAFASSIRMPFLSKPNPYYRTLGWNAYARTAGQLARKLGISVIASDTRAEVASLLYYWRDQPEQILAWPTADDLPGFDLTRGLTAAAPQPVLFVSQCQAADRLEEFYAKVTPLGVFGFDDPVPRGFAAFKLEAPRGPIGPLAECPVG